jgi:hypothetical protein
MRRKEGSDEEKRRYERRERGERSERTKLMIVDIMPRGTC